METQLEKAHRLNQILLDKLDAVCRKYQIQYFLDSGCLIGAARHQSFIPWDDDVDISFKREEYNKLCQVPKEEWGEDFRLIDASEMTPDGFHDFMPHLVYLKESIEMKSYVKTQNRISGEYNNRMVVDIILIDHAYSSSLMQKLLLYRLFWIYGQAMAFRDTIDYSSYTLLQRIFIFVASGIGKRRRLENIYAAYTKACQSAKKKRTHYFRSNATVPYLHFVYPIEWYDKSTALTINSRRYNAPAGYHEILTRMYGDYMTPPPVNERVTMHIKNEDAAE